MDWVTRMAYIDMSKDVANLIMLHQVQLPTSSDIAHSKGPSIFIEPIERLSMKV